MEILKVQNLSKVYGKGDTQIRALDDVSFNVEKGEFVAIVGSSGSSKSALITSAMKNVNVAVHNYLKMVADGSVQAGISTSALQNGGVGLAPFHDWDSKITADLKAQIRKARDAIRDRSIKIDLQ